MMRNRVVWLMSALLLGFIMSGPCSAQDVVNLLDNGGFEDGVMAPWSIYGGATGTVVQDDPAEGAYCLHIDVTAVGANFWDAGLQHSGHVFEQGKDYTLSAFVKCSEGELDINFKPELGADPWTGYGSQAFTMTEEWQEFSVYTGVMAANVDPATITFHIGYAVTEFWIDGVRFYEGEYVPPVFITQTAATNPIPLDLAGDVPQDVILGWQPTELAATHDVYFGTNVDDVNAASVGNPMGVLVSQGQTETEFDPEGLLDFSQTYYWRVDEVNSAPDKTVFKGNIWSFTAEPFSVPLGVTSVTASSATSGMDPDNTINGSGLDAADAHDTNSQSMWLTDNVAGPHWIQYAFDMPYKLDTLMVWNQNQGIEAFLGFGAKDVVVEYAVDGENWTVLEGVTELTQATGLPGYVANTTVDFAGAVAQQVRITINDNWGSFSTQSGLSEVQFLYIPTYPRTPQPANGSTTGSVDVELSWRSGRGATSHGLSLDTNPAAVVDGTAVVATTTEASYAASLDYGTSYFWQTVEMSGDDAFASPVWRFTTPTYRILEDFESYSGDVDTEIFMSWWDGFGGDATLGGSTTGHIDAPFVERLIVNSGRQSLPMFFDNNGGFIDLDGQTSAPTFSEVTYEFASTQDLTLGNATTLAVAIRGNAPTDGEPGNATADPLYLTLTDTSGKTVTVTHPDAAVIQSSVWQDWLIPLADLEAIRLDRVKSVTIGVGSQGTAGGEGIIYVDDLRVGTPASASPAVPTTGDAVNLLTNGGFEDGVIDPWTVYGGVTSEVVYGEAAEGNASLHLIVTDPGENSWNAGLQQIGHVFEAGKKYTVSAFLKTTPGSTLDIHYKPELAADPWTGFGAQTFTITDEWVEYSVTTDVLAANVDPASITFHIGFAVAEFWIDSIRFYEGDYVAP